MSTTQEHWNAIPGYEGRYEVSDQGRFRSWVNNAGNRRTIPKILKITPIRCGNPRNQIRYTIGLSDNNKCRKRHYAGRLVLLAICGPCPDGKECCHWDDDQINNKLSNLRWGTRLENAQDKERNGKQISGESHHNAKLSWSQVDEIKSRLKNGERQIDLAREYDVWKGTISAIKTGRSWRR